jgi:hypothetical protein
MNSERAGLAKREMMKNSGASGERRESKNSGLG